MLEEPKAADVEATVADDDWRPTYGVPSDLKNAYLQPGLVMRVGIPHRGGKLTSEAFEREYPVMVSAAAFWNPKKQAFQIPDATNLWEVDLALDSAGFTATRLWAQKGRQNGIGGFYPWSLEQYVELAALVPRSFWSQPDLCNEPEVAKSPDEVDFRVRKTAELLDETMAMVYSWHNQMARKGWTSGAIRNTLPLPVPVLQGWTVEDYLKSLELMLKVWKEWQPWAADPVLIGIGSVCRRSLNDKKSGLRAILAGLEPYLPKSSRLHLFGVKGAVLREVKMMPWIASVDSMAFDLQARQAALQSNMSNSMAHRCETMRKWMDKAGSQMAPQVGDQFRLPM